MCTVTVAVHRAVCSVYFVDTGCCAASKVVMRESNPGIDDVGVDPRTGSVPRVGVVEREIVLIDPIKTPVRTRLGIDDMHHLRLFDVGDGRMLSEGRGSRVGQMRGEAAQCVRVREAERTRMRGDERSRGAADVLDRGFQYDDVLARNQFLRRAVQRRVQRDRAIPPWCDRHRRFGASNRTNRQRNGDAPDQSPHELNPPTK